MSQRANPFPGLRPFHSTEDYLFFGREGQCDDLLRRLQQSRFVAVVGVSGSGKSSLVQAGLLPSLVGGLMAEAGSRWRIAMLRPGSDPIANLAHALLHPAPLTAEDEGDEAAVDMVTAADRDPGVAREIAIRAGFVDATLRRGGLGLVEAVAQLPLAAEEKLLVIVNQFEELFRYATIAVAGGDDPTTDDKRTLAQESSAAFVRLLLEASQSSLAPVYVVITMRSDFLGDCAQFRDLPEAINHGQYLIPRMTRDQRRRAIEGPVAVGGATMTPRLVQRLLNDVGDSPDQLPILQHALMRTWGNWQQGDSAAPLDLPHYEATGGMAQALSNHADEVYEALPDDNSRRLIKQIFKELTQLGPDNRGVRRPVSLAQLSQATGASMAAIITVLAPFRQADCAFIAPPAEVALTPQSTIDISHESLMRIWQRLDSWVAEEAQDAVWLRRLGEAAQLYATGEAGLWRDPQLALALTWQTEKAPTAAWAARYVTNFAAGLAFLAESQAAQLAEAQRAEAQVRAQEAARLAEVLVRAQEAAHQQELERQRQVAELQRQRAEESEANARQLRQASTRLRWLATGLALAVLAAVLVAWFAIVESNLAAARALVTEARNQSGDLRLATLLALEAKAVAPSEPEVNRLLTHDLFTRKPLLYVNRVQSYTGHMASVWSVAWSPDGKTVASASGDDTIKLWNVATGQTLTTLQGHTDSVWSVAWSPDGKTVASASGDDTIKLWNVATGQLLTTLQGHTASVRSVAWSPDGKTVASASDDRTIKLWNVATGQLLTTLQGHTASVWSVAWSPDGKTVASASIDRTIKLWNVATGQTLTTLQGHTASVWSVAWSPDGKTVASASDDGTIKLWDVVTGQTLTTLQDHTASVRSVAWSPDGKTVASASIDRTIKLWSVATGQTLTTLQGHTNYVNSVAWSPDGKTVASASGDDTIKLWNVATGQTLTTLQGHTASVRSVAWSPDGKTVASASDDRTIKLWDVVTGQTLTTLQGHTASVWSVAWSPDGKTVASASDDRTIKLWNVATGQTLTTLQGHTASVWSVAWSPDGKTVASASVDGTIKLWNVATGQLLTTLQGHTASVLSVAWSPDGKTVASASDDRTIKLWNVATGQLLTTLQGHTASVWSVAWSPDGKTVASASGDDTIKLWNVATGQTLTTLQGHTNYVNSVAWSPDGKTVASASDDGTIKLWDVVTGQTLTTLQDHTASVLSVAWSPDGKTVASASIDRTIKLWPIPLIRNPCRLVYENLRTDEWLTYHPWAIYQPTCPDRPMPSIPSVGEAIRDGNFDLLMITWPGRLVVVGTGMLALLLAGLGLWWLYHQLRSRPRVIVLILGIIGLVLLWPVYRLAIVHEPLVLFGTVVPLQAWQIYLWSTIGGLLFGLLLWGIYEMLRAKWRAIFALVMMLLLVGLLAFAGEPFDWIGYGLVAVAGLVLALLLWGLFRLLGWLWRKLLRWGKTTKQPAP